MAQTAPAPIGLLLADDHTMFRSALRRVLEAETDLRVIGEAGDGLSLMRQAAQVLPDVVCMDVRMPGIDGIEATRQLLTLSPRTRVIGLSALQDRYHVNAMLSAGARGYVSKADALEEIVRAVRWVHSRTQPYLSPGLASDWIARTALQRDSALSRREREVLRCIAQGMTSARIARDLDIAIATVEVHRRNLMRKLDLHSIAELTKFAIREGLIEP
jgi:two-component system NarL family response regulator